MKHLTPEQLSACLDDELRGKAREEAKAHLTSCAECQGELAKLAALEKLTRASEPEPRDEAYFQTFSSRVMADIAKEKPIPLGESLREWFKKITAVPVFRLQWLGGLAVAALVIGFGIYIYQRPELVRPAYKATPPAVENRKPVETPPVVAERRLQDNETGTATPSVSGEMRGAGDAAKVPEAARTEAEAGKRPGKVAEVEQPVALASKPPAPAPEAGLVPAERSALDKSVTATTRAEAPREEAKKEKIEDLKARPEGYVSAPEAGAASTATVTKGEDHIARMAPPSEREKSGEKAGSDEVLFAEAQTKQSNQYYRDAAKDYDSLVRNYPKSARYDDANYNLALSEYANSQQTRKAEDLRRALKVSKIFLKAARDTARKAQVNRQVVVLERQIKEIK